MSTRVDVTGPLPGVNRVFTFPEWRFTPTQETLLFNFKTQVHTEEEAIDIIAQEYGLDSIAAARQLKHPAIVAKSWMILETLFKTAAQRTEALCYGVMYRKRVYIPITTCTQAAAGTIISFFGMPIQPEKDAMFFAATKAQNIWSAGTKGDLDNMDNIISGRAAIKARSNPSGNVGITREFKRADYGASFDNSNLNNSGVLRLTRPKDSHIWLQKNCYGVFTGNATVVADGFDELMAEKKNGSLAYYVAAPEYPLLEIYVRRCQMYCTRCRTLNHHQTDDCTGLDAEKLHDPNDDSPFEDNLEKESVQKKPADDETLFKEEDSDEDPDYQFVESSSESGSDDNDNGMDSDTSPRCKSV